MGVRCQTRRVLTFRCEPILQVFHSVPAGTLLQFVAWMLFANTTERDGAISVKRSCRNIFPLSPQPDDFADSVPSRNTGRSSSSRRAIFSEAFLWDPTRTTSVTASEDHPKCSCRNTPSDSSTALPGFVYEMFLQEHLDVFCTQFTNVHSNSPLQLKCDADYAAE